MIETDLTRILQSSSLNLQRCWHCLAVSETFKFIGGSGRRGRALTESEVTRPGDESRV